MKFYGYKRVSTERQDIGRQTDALNSFQKEHNITIDEVFTDYYTGKTFNRDKYIKQKQVIKNGDYLIVKEVIDLVETGMELKKNEMN